MNKRGATIETNVLRPKDTSRLYSCTDRGASTNMVNSCTHSSYMASNIIEMGFLPGSGHGEGRGCMNKNTTPRKRQSKGVQTPKFGGFTVQMGK